MRTHHKHTSHSKHRCTATIRPAAIILATALALSTGASGAGAADKPSIAKRSAPLAAAGTVVLRNDEGEAVSFYLSRCEQPGKPWTIAAGEVEPFPCKNGCDICVPTSGTVKVGYALRERARYRIYWNGAQTRWDVAEFGQSDDD